MPTNITYLAPLEGRYANYCQVSHSAGEFVLDFGQLTPDAVGPVIHSRIVATPSSVVAMLRILGDSIRQHTAEFGQPAGGGGLSYIEKEQ